MGVGRDVNVLHFDISPRAEARKAQRRERRAYGMSSPPQSHRARKKKQGIPPAGRGETTNDVLDSWNTANVPPFTLAALFWPARGLTQWFTIPVVLTVAFLFRCITASWGYSGLNKPPMHGDFEAQRHWMEITTHLPISMWYFYHLPYWGLDYPPLTAYHSWLCGKFGSLIDSSWFALDKSRGMEAPMLKLFMRSTVVISEYLIYIPAVIVFLRHYARNQGIGSTSTGIALAAVLLQPATILIDHGHFQYNTVMLGFMVATVSSIFAGRLLWSCIFFVAALGFKQMALYYAPVIFAFLLGSCITLRLRPDRLLAIGIVTILAFAALFAPLLLGSLHNIYTRTPLPSFPPPPLLAERRISLDQTSPFGMMLLQLTQSIHRIFPFARGLFEDKVANFWCLLNTVYKLHHLNHLIPLPRLSLLATLVSILPASLTIGAVPAKHLLPYALASCSWGFFLFSFQVHEKSVLLPLLPMTLLLGSKHGLSREYRAWIGWANLLGCWTMYPLLKRDGLVAPYAVLSLLWALLLDLPQLNLAVFPGRDAPGGPEPGEDVEDVHLLTKLLHMSFFIAMGVWHVLEAYVPPPAGKPDLWVVLNACLGALGFGVCYLWCTWKLIVESGLLDEYFSYAGRDRETAAEEDKKEK